MANKLKLFVLKYSLVDAYIFVLAKNERDLFKNHSELLICDDVYHSELSTIPDKKRTDAACHKKFNQLVRNIIAIGTVSVSWRDSNNESYRGEVSWEEYEVSDIEIAFLQRIGLLKIETSVAKTF